MLRQIVSKQIPAKWTDVDRILLSVGFYADHPYSKGEFVFAEGEEISDFGKLLSLAESIQIEYYKHHKIVDHFPKRLIASQILKIIMKDSKSGLLLLNKRIGMRKNYKYHSGYLAWLIKFIRDEKVKDQNKIGVKKVLKEYNEYLEKIENFVENQEVKGLSLEEANMFQCSYYWNSSFVQNARR